MSSLSLFFSTLLLGFQITRQTPYWSEYQPENDGS